MLRVLLNSNQPPSSYLLHMHQLQGNMGGHMWYANNKVDIVLFFVANIDKNDGF